MRFYSFLFLGLLPSFLLGTDVTQTRTEDREFFSLAKQSKIELYRSHALSDYSPQITRVIIIIHGIARNADEYFSHIQGAVRQEKKEYSTLVIAPHFKIEEDPKDKEEVYWGEGSWKFGDVSNASSSSNSISSYEVVDKLIEELVLGGKFPSLQHIVVAGHSAGGQFVTRYAAGSPIPDRLSTHLSYIVANPSSYLYFNPTRYEAGKGFVAPETSCREYHDYPYGVEKPNYYMAMVNEKELSLRYNHRSVTVFLGESDTLTEDLDMSCEANLQGKNRYGRGLTFYQFLKTFFPRTKVKLATAPGIGHSGKEMYQSAAGRRLLFQ